MNEPKDGGPAFPGNSDTCGGSFLHEARDPNTGLPYFVIVNPGMSLRDWFAGMALFGAGTLWRNCITEQDVTKNAYRIADAMIAEREKGTK